MNRIVLVTGANGHLGRTLVAQLAAQGTQVRALVLPGESAPTLEEANIPIVRGDVRSPSDVKELFAGLAGRQVVVVHAAAIIDITSKVSKKAYEVNVQGTKNVVEAALACGVWRFVHISSVHAIPEAPGLRTIREVKRFSPDQVQGGYAKTKAEASQYVMDAIQNRGLPGILLHPSGIIGPGDTGSNNVVAAVRQYLAGRLPACPRGGYDLVDVRDVAAAAATAIDKGRVGETYILSGRHYEFTQLFRMVRDITGKGRRCPVVPTWMAKLAAPVLERRALRKSEKPLVTRYSMNALQSNDNFSHQKASRELDFWPRDIYDTLRDTLASLKKETPKRAPRRARAQG